MARPAPCKLEEYFTGRDELVGTPLGSLGTVTFGPASLHDLRSVTKGVVSTPIGIAIGNGEIPSVEARLSDLLPETGPVVRPSRVP
jgi:CubicO group peptidase (beta-lactamase class C family)